MHRRNFLIGGASAAALSGTVAGEAVAALGRDLIAGRPVGPIAAGPSALAQRAGKKAAAGREVELTGYATPAAAGPGHYLVFAEDAPCTDPAVADARAWPQRAIRVYPTNGAAARLDGPVKVKGRLFAGGFHDTPTGTGARRVLVGAVTAA